MPSLKTCLVVCLLLTAGLSAAPAAADVIVPEEWVGIWEIQVATYDCDTNDLLFSTTVYDTICPGWAFADPDQEEIDLTCTGSADANSYSQHCEGSSTPFPGCEMSFVFDGTGSRTGDTYTAITTTSSTFVGACFSIPDSCSRTEVTGTRIDDTPDQCTETAEDQVSWSALKGHYR